MEKTLIDFEKRINLLNVQMPLDEKLSSVKDNLSGCFEFDPSGAYANSFSFSNRDKTGALTGSQGCKPLFAKSPLPRSQKTTFSLKIDKCPSQNLVIGICPDHLKTSPHIYEKIGVYCYHWMYGSVLYNGQASFQGLAYSCSVGKIIAVTVDLFNNTVNFELNGASIQTTNLDSNHTSSYNYYPFVEFGDTNDEVSFL